MAWYDRPTIIDDWPEEIDYIMFVDENGSHNLKYLIRKLKNNINHSSSDLENFFTVTGCVLARNNFPEVRNAIISLKNKYWENGLFYYNKQDTYKRVCFHSSEIRNKRGPFSAEVINYCDFIADLTAFMTSLDYVIFSSHINKLSHLCTYINPKHPYALCLEFIIERFGKFFLKPINKSGLIVLESRGKNEDKNLLKRICEILKNGTKFVESSDLANIKGVYFNPKWDKSEKRTYFGLEIADLTSYPIHKYCISKEKDRAYQSIESKFYGYPEYNGKGLKIFPKN
ncbi:DUF3800 domain-containing protein [Carboxydocella sp. ULO1]|uniref:DUF3800 domain-containing protein n=1 Tax=Carboxydocella sp. ULO1 TaxID=1926599 RepID=UPI0009AC0273|nr:DUF3800 domain-containing protein [Carboxydocella sp. ULO1]